MPRSNPSRMPLPGEHPSSVYGHKKARRKQKPEYGFIRNFGPAVLLVLGFVLIAWVWVTVRIPVTVVVNGQPVEVRTHRRTALGAVEAAGLDAAQVVFIEPALSERIGRNDVVTVAFVRPVVIYADGNRYEVATQSTDVRTIAAQAGIALDVNDGVNMLRFSAPTAAEVEANPDLLDVPIVPQELQVVREQTLIVNEVLPDGMVNRVSLTTAAQSVGEALIDAGYTLYAADDISVSLTDAPFPGQEITITRSKPVTIQADGLRFETHTHSDSVVDILAENGLALLLDDYTIPAVDSSVEPNGTIQLVRVTYQNVEEEVPIPFDTRYVPDPDMDLDELFEIQTGQPGTRVLQTRVRYEDGVEVAQIPSGEWVSEYPQAQVIAYGTNIVLRTETTIDGQITYWRKLRMLATSYSPLTAGEKQPGDPFFGLSATGAEVVRGIVATDPRVVPLGTSVYVPNYGTGVALDIGGAVKGMRIDLGYDDANLVLWNNWTDVYLTPPVPPPDQIVWVLPEIAQVGEEVSQQN